MATRLWTFNFDDVAEAAAAEETDDIAEFSQSTDLVDISTLYVSSTTSNRASNDGTGNTIPIPKGPSRTT